MATATLLYPTSFSILGRHRFVKGTPTTVSDELAAYLAQDPRFLIEGAGDAEATTVIIVAAADSAAVVQQEEPGNGTTLAEALDLVPEADDNYDEDGRPSLAALSLLVGRVVTEEERDQALAAAAEQPQAGEVTDSETTQIRTRIVRRKKAKPDPTTEDAQEI